MIVAAILSLWGFLPNAQASQQTTPINQPTTWAQEEADIERFYATLRVKPWGNVAGRYIDALKQEEAGLIQEVCSCLRSQGWNVSPENWSKVKEIRWPNVFRVAQRAPSF